MKNIWLRRLLPACVVSLVLVFSYFLPAVGLVPPPVNQSFPLPCRDGIHDSKHGYGYGCPGPKPVKSPTHTLCNQFGDGHHGGKDSIVCPSPTPGPPPAVHRAPPFVEPPLGSGGGRGQGAGVSTPISKPVVDAPVSDGVSRWRAFMELVLREMG
jgi:hypothetical protein